MEIAINDFLIKQDNYYLVFKYKIVYFEHRKF